MQAYDVVLRITPQSAHEEFRSVKHLQNDSCQSHRQQVSKCCEEATLH